MHYHLLLLASLSALVLPFPLSPEDSDSSLSSSDSSDSSSHTSILEPRNSYPWVSAYPNDNTECHGDPSKDQPYTKLKKGNTCYPFAPTMNNIGWSWGAGTGFTVSRIKFYSDANCEHSLLWADMRNVSNKHGYCLPTKEFQEDYPQWDPKSPPILSVMSGSDDCC